MVTLIVGVHGTATAVAPEYSPVGSIKVEVKKASRLSSQSNANFLAQGNNRVNGYPLSHPRTQSPAI